jgi:hypothetical protein
MLNRVQALLHLLLVHLSSSVSYFTYQRGVKKKKKQNSESEREREIGKRIQELGIIPSYQELDLCGITTTAEDLEAMAKEKH